MLAVMAVAAAATGIGFGLVPAGQEGQQSTSPLPSLDSFVLDWDTLAHHGSTVRPTASNEKDEEEEHDLSALRLVSRVMFLVQENYVEPDRVDPREMLLGALDFIEKRIPEVLVDDTDAEEKNRVTLTVNRSTTHIALTGLNAVWDIAPRLKKAFSFIQENLVTTEDTRRIEYAAINGMLSTLDPHSNLLDPEQYSDMKMHTRGEFGGLGFVVSMRDGRLTVMRIIPNTPAHQGGVKPRDVITQIEDESTINMGLTDAVNRLRGKPGTPVNFWIDRDGFEEPKRFTLDRAIIEIESIDPVRLLADSVGYIRVTNFQGHTTRDLRKAIAKLREEAGQDINGLVLDLRGNPGGLLEQAIHVADLFIDRGTIESTVGMNNRLQERKTASREGTLSDIPLIVLVSNTSASASEIVGGAVRNLDRGLVLGNPTFGKGSVQVLYDLVDKSALKLTIAQYLTPGDVSIQDMGIVPDIELTPALVAENRVMVFAPRRTLRESDLESLYGDGESPVTPAIGLDPFETRRPEAEGDDQEVVSTLTYLRDDVPDDEEIDEFEEPEWEADFHVELARAILADAGAPTRRVMLERGKKVIEERRKEERRRIYSAISDLGVDWTPSPKEENSTSSNPNIDASLRFDGPSRAGKETHLSITLTNKSDETLHRIRAWTESTTPRTVRHSLLFDRLEFLFGKLAPGEERTWRVPVELPSDITARREMLDIRVEADGHDSIPSVQALLDIEELPRPSFAFAWQISPSDEANDDGRLSLGKSANIDVFVKNIGEGSSSEAVATIKNLEDQHVYITRGRHHIGELKPGDTDKASMTLELRDGFEKDAVKMRVTVLDHDRAQYVSDEIEIPVARERIEPAPASGAVRLNDSSVLLGWASADAAGIAKAAEGATLPVDARVGDMFRVQWSNERTGFVPADAVRLLPRSRRQPTGEITALFPHSPPLIVLNGDLQAAVTEADRIVISGVTKATDELRDIYIFINNDKVFFKAWQPELDTVGVKDSQDVSTANEPNDEARKDGSTDSAKPRKESLRNLRRIPFEATLPLQDGANSVIIFARKTDELQARQQIVIFRTPEALQESSVDAKKEASSAD